MQKPTSRWLIVLFASHLASVSAATVYVDVNSSNPVPPYTNWATASTDIQLAVNAARAGDVVLVTNGVYRSGGKVASGALTNRVTVDKALTLQSVNGPDTTFIEGYQVPGVTNGDSAVRCVYLVTGASLIGFTLTNGATRAVPTSPDGNGAGVLVLSPPALVSNCVLVGNVAVNTGGGAGFANLSNCVVSGNVCRLAGGGAFNCNLTGCLVANNTAAGGGGIRGGTAANCVLSNNFATDAQSAGGGAESSVLNHCALFGNQAPQGGGASHSTLSDCVIAGNSAFVSTVFGSGVGGGCSDSTLHRCLVSNNSAASAGGGAMFSFLDNSVICSNSAPNGGGVFGYTLTNCTVVWNSATNGGGYLAGVSPSVPVLKNCILYFNSAATNANHDASSTTGPGLVNCCTVSSVGVNLVTNEPLFVDPAAGNFRLQSSSPCINSGDTTVSGPDFDGNPRVVGGTVDIGAYEFQSPSSILSYAWAQQYGLPTDGSADFVDTDGDGMNNWQEWISGTVPTNALSLLKMLSISNNLPGLKVTWQSVIGRSYDVQRTTSLASPAAFSTLLTNIAGQTNSTAYIDTTATNPGPYFYRVRVLKY